MPSATAAAGEVLAAEASTISAATTAADTGSGPATSQANKDDHAWQAGPAHCEDWQLAMDYRDRPDRSTPEALGFDLIFTNVGPQPCSFDGWPGLVAEGADGETLTWALASGSTSTLVVLPRTAARQSQKARRHRPSVSGCAEATTDHCGPTSRRTEPVAESSTTSRSPSARMGRGRSGSDR